MSTLLVRSRRTALLAGVAVLALSGLTLSGAAHAAPADRDARVRALEDQVKALSQAIESLKAEGAAAKAAADQATAKVDAATVDTASTAALAAQVEDLKRSTSNQYADVQAQRAADPRLTVNNGRPTWTSADGRFSAALRALIQFDAANYAQDKRNALAPDLSSGTNFRRARFGVEGTVFGDWNYSFIYDLGSGSGQEAASISDAYLQYNGIAPFHFRIGSFATPSGLEDQTGAGDLIFLERAAPTDLARGIGGSDGRQNLIDVIAQGDDYFASLAWTGDRYGATGEFDEQQAAVGRLAYRVYKDQDTNVLLSANATYVSKAPDAVASPGASNLRLRVIPENAVDDNATRLIDTNNIDASHYLQWGLEGGANWKNLYAQGGYFHYDVERRTGTLPDPDFDGWYAQATWILTGEARRYAAATASWQGPVPSAPFDFNKGNLGAWEVAGRYSDTDLNYLPLNSTATGGIRGGDQKAWTVGLNWYPNANVRVLFNYQHLDVDRLSGAAAPFTNIGQKVDIGAIRTQLAF